MKVRVSTYAYFDQRRRGEGLRIGCSRYLVRGVKKDKYAALDIFDVWLPTLAPSRPLLRWALDSGLEDSKRWKTYVRRFRNEMTRTEPRQTIRLLAMVTQKTPISLGCHCRSNHCHRFILEELIRQAAAGRF
jgi:uncharacterized protein YeaO (DUF488 family)